jgi:hypothetical protein
MKLNAISNLRIKWFNTEKAEMTKRERFIVNIITTRAFSKLTLQNKVLSLGKLITIFRLDNGYTPKSLERILEVLVVELRSHDLKTWDELYSDKAILIHPTQKQ